MTNNPTQENIGDFRWLKPEEYKKEGFPHSHQSLADLILKFNPS